MNYYFPGRRLHSASRLPWPISRMRAARTIIAPDARNPGRLTGKRDSPLPQFALIRYKEAPLERVRHVGRAMLHALAHSYRPRIPRHPPATA